MSVRCDFDQDDPGTFRFSYDLLCLRGVVAECSQDSVRLSDFDEAFTQRWLKVIPRLGSSTVEVLVAQQSVILLFDTEVKFFDLGSGEGLGRSTLSMAPKLLCRLETPGLLPLAWTGSALVPITDIVLDSQSQQVANLLQRS